MRLPGGVRVSLACAAALLLAVGASCSQGVTPQIGSPAASPTPNPPRAAVPTEPVAEPSPTTAFSPTAPLAPTATLAPASEYRVLPGDTLLALASAWGVSMASIQEASGLGEVTSLKAGDLLVVPPADVREDDSTYWVVYAVREGETLGHIATRYGFSVARIMEVNELDDANLIRAGQEIVLPLNTLASYAEVPQADPAPELSVQTPTPPVTPLLEIVADVAVDEPTEGAPPAQTPAEIADWPREVIRIINDIRAQHGLPPYHYNETLAQAGQAHANDCVNRGWCSHTGSDGSSVKDRVIREGYGGTGWAECWAQRQSPQGAVDIWMDEVPPDDPHRRMMLHTWFTEVGVGIAEAPWGYYFIADFGRP